MVVIPKDDWLCSNCTTGQPNAISFEEYSAKVNSQDVADFIKLPITAPSEIASSHVSFRYQKNDWRIPTPLLSKEEYVSPSGIILCMYNYAATYFCSEKPSVTANCFFSCLTRRITRYLVLLRQ